LDGELFKLVVLFKVLVDYPTLGEEASVVGRSLRPPEDVQVRVFDSSADMRYLVLPLRPGGTEDLTEDELAALVTRDSMIGVTPAREPQPV